MNSDVTITHNHDEGTLCIGVPPHVQAAHAVTAFGFVYAPSLGVAVAVIPHSRDTVAPRVKIRNLAARLREARYTVTVEIDDTHRPEEVIRAEQRDALEDRADRHRGRAERSQGAMDAATDSADQASARFAGGQPILKGHHSEKGARTAQKRIDHALTRFVEAREALGYHTWKADRAERRLELNEDPVLAARRIQRHETDLREVDRSFTQAHGDKDRILELDGRRAQLQRRIAYDRKILDEARRAGQYVSYSRETVHVGDLVKVKGLWRKVAKLNPKTVGVESGYSWLDRYPYTEITELNCPHTKESP